MPNWTQVKNSYPHLLFHIYNRYFLCMPFCSLSIFFLAYFSIYNCWLWTKNFLTLLHSEWPNLYGVLAVLSAKGLKCAVLVFQRVLGSFERSRSFQGLWCKWSGEAYSDLILQVSWHHHPKKRCYLKLFRWPPVQSLDGSNERSQHIFALRNKKKYLWVILSALSNLKLCTECAWFCSDNRWDTICRYRWNMLISLSGPG